MRYLLLGLCVAVSLAQSPGNQIYTLSAVAGDASLAGRNIMLDPPFTMKRDSTKYLHLGVNVPATDFSEDFITVTSADGSRRIYIDTSHISFRSGVVPLEVGVPMAPGQCSIGTAGWNANDSGLYYCIRNPDTATQNAVPFVWSQPNRFSVPDPANPGQWIWQAIP